MSKLQRELVSRATAGAIGLVLLVGAWKLVATAAEMSAEATERARQTNTLRDKRMSGAGHLYVVAALLSVVGLPCVIYAVTPPWVVERLFRPTPPETGDRGMPDVHHRTWWWPF